MSYRLPALRTLLLTAIVALIASAVLALARPVEMRVDGQRVQTDVPPIATSSTKAYVPLRTLADALGAETLVQGDRISIVLGNQSLRLRIGDTHALLNGMPFTFAKAPFRVRGRVMVGLHALARALDVRATYNPRTARIDVLTTGIGQAGTSAVPETE